VYFKGNKLATVERSRALIDMGLHPYLIVRRAILALGEFGDAFAEKLTRRRFDRGESPRATRDLGRASWSG
jgi:hypothetical protein